MITQLDLSPITDYLSSPISLICSISEKDQYYHELSQESSTDISTTNMFLDSKEDEIFSPILKKFIGLFSIFKSNTKDNSSLILSQNKFHLGKGRSKKKITGKSTAKFHYKANCSDDDSDNGVVDDILRHRSSNYVPYGISSERNTFSSEETPDYISLSESCFSHSYYYSPSMESITTHRSCLSSKLSISSTRKRKTVTFVLSPQSVMEGDNDDSCPYYYYYTQQCQGVPLNAFSSDDFFNVYSLSTKGPIHSNQSSINEGTIDEEFILKYYTDLVQSSIPCFSRSAKIIPAKDKLCFEENPSFSTGFDIPLSENNTDVNSNYDYLLEYARESSDADDKTTSQVSVDRVHRLTILLNDINAFRISVD